MSDSTSDQPAPGSPVYGIEDLRAWIEQLADPTGGTPLRGYLRAALVDLLAYRVEEDRADQFYHRPDGIEEVEWMRPYRELVDSLPLKPDEREILNAAFDGLYSRTVREVALTTGSEDRLREQLLRAMPQGFSTRERVAAVVERLHEVHYRAGLPPAIAHALVSVETELRAIAGPPVVPGPTCSCPDGPSLLCPVPQHRADAAGQIESVYGDPVWRANRVRNDPEFARALREQRTAAESPEPSGG